MCWQCSGAVPSRSCSGSPHCGCSLCPALTVASSWLLCRPGPTSGPLFPLRVQAGAAEVPLSEGPPLGWEEVGLGGCHQGVGITRGLLQGLLHLLQPPQALLLLPSGTRFHPAPPSSPAGPRDFSFSPAGRPHSQSQSHPGSRPGRCPSSALPAAETGLCCPHGLRTTPEPPFHQRPERAMGPGITPPAPHQC